ncbi:MAG TPA: hypothetical protein VMU87_22655 [Stellaceae bacterium]|nr:hypothetical protein [Stellaceae bacterium]
MRPDPKIDGRHRRPRHWLLGILAVTVIGTLVVAFSFRDQARTAAGEPPIPREASLASWDQNGQGGRYLLQIADGSVPNGAAVSGVVTSDTNCAPDAQGLSHCRNGIALSNGDRITVIDIHTMSRNPCLQPGETLSMTRIDPSWLVATARPNG